MPREFFDVVVLGQSLGAIALAGLMARRSYRVLVLGQGQPAPSYHLGADRLPQGPSPWLAQHAPVLERFREELALPVRAIRRRSPAAFQLVAPAGRCTLSSNPEQLKDELERLRPRPTDLDEVLRAVATAREIDSIVDGSRALPPTRWWDKRRLRQRLQSLAHAMPQQRSNTAELLGAGVHFGARLDPSRLEPIAWYRALGAWLESSAELHLDKVWDLLLRRLRELEVAYRPKNRALALRDKARKVTSVFLHPDGEEIACSWVISTLPSAATMRLVDSSQSSSRAHADANLPAGTQPSPYGNQDLSSRANASRQRFVGTYTLNAIAETRFVSAALGGRALWISPLPSPVADEGTVLLERRNSPVKGRTVISLHALIDHEPNAASVGFKPGKFTAEQALQASGTETDKRTSADPRKRRQALVEHLGHLLPYLSEGLVAVHSPHDGLAPDLLRADEALAAEIARLPATRPAALDNAFAVYPRSPVNAEAALPGAPLVSRDPEFELLPGTTFATPLRDLLLAGPDAFPALGQEGELLAAWLAAEAIRSQDKSKARLRARSWTRSG